MNRLICKYACTFILFFFLLIVYSYAEADDNNSLTDILGRMERADETARVIRFDFKQVINFKITGEKQSKSGEIIFQKPDKIRIWQKTPAEQLFTGNGKKIWVYTPSYKQVVVENWKNWRKNNDLAYSFISIAESFREFKKKYNFKLIPGKDKYIHLTLVSKSGGLPPMELLVDNDLFIPITTKVFLENTEVATDITEIQLNPLIKSDLFNFKVPKGTEVIELAE